MGDKLRVAILGCGAITRSAHLPAAVLHPGVRIVALVDSDAKRAGTLARSCGLDSKIAAQASHILKDVDAVINALPNHLHVPVSLECMQAGIHVLCEKPLATTAAEARICCETAAEKGVVLAIGMNRRFENSTPLLHLLLAENFLGPLQEYDCQYGAVYDWGTASGFYFSKAQAGGGVLLDHGVHMLDSLVDWFGPVAQLEYQDDDWGSGLEANAIVLLRHQGTHGELPGRLRLSRTCNLKNRLLICGRDARAEIRANDSSKLIIYRQMQGQQVSLTMDLDHNEKPGRGTSFYRQLDNFVNSIRGTEKPVVDGWQALAVTELIERCYEQAQRLSEPWCQLPQKQSETAR